MGSSIIGVVVSTSFPFYLHNACPHTFLKWDQNESIQYYIGWVWRNDPQHVQHAQKTLSVPGSKKTLVFCQALAFTNHSCLPNCRVEFASGFAAWGGPLEPGTNGELGLTWKGDIYIYYTDWWFGTIFIFPYIGNVIIPTDEVIFFRGLGQPPTSVYVKLLVWRGIHQEVF